MTERVAGIAVAALLGGVASPAAALPSRDWAGARDILVVCRTAAERPAEALRLRARLDAVVPVRLAALSALPVAAADFGDQRMYRAGTVVLLVNARVAGKGSNRSIAVAIRPWRAAAGEDGDLFGAAPRAAQVDDRFEGPEFDAAIDAALTDVLPRQGNRG